MELKTQFALSWPYYILRILAKNNDVEAEVLLFKYWSKFLSDYCKD